MELAEVVALLAIGAAMGGLIVFAWMSDAPRYSHVDPTEDGRYPL